jgi:hypothetical protein
VGNVGPDSNSWGWSFRGQRILEAILDTISSPVTVVVESRVHFLNHTHEDVNTTYTTLPLAAGHRLLFSGCSAGARGAMFNVDYVSQFVRPGVEIRALFDSPLWIDVQPFEANITSLENETQAIYGLVNATARIPAACAATYPGDEGWKCLFGQVRPGAGWLLLLPRSMAPACGCRPPARASTHTRAPEVLQLTHA